MMIVWWAIFCPFTLLTARKMKITKKLKKKKKKKNAWRFHHTGVPKLMIICYTVPEIWCVMDVIAFFHSGLFFAFLPPNSPKNQNFLKKWKRHLEISSFYTSVLKIVIICYTVPEIWRVMDVIVISHFGQFFALLLP